MIAEIAAVVAPLFVIAGIGVWWGRSRRPFDTEMIGALVLNLGVPCLIFATLTQLDISLAAFAEMAGAYAVALAVTLALAAAALRALGFDLRSFLPAMVFPNNGNMGLPLALFAFGEAGLALAIAAFVVSWIGNLTLAPALAAGRLSLAEAARRPHIYAIAAALVFMASGTPAPAWLANTTRTLGAISIPLMLIALGVSLSRLEVRRVGRSLALAVFRLGVGFAVALAVAEAFGLSGTARGVLILQSAMPTAVVNYLFAVRFGRAAGEVAGIVVISTAISFATLPLLLAVVLGG